MVSFRRTVAEMTGLAADLATWAFDTWWPALYPPQHTPSVTTDDTPEKSETPQRPDMPRPNGAQPQQPVVQWGLQLPNGTIVWDNCLYAGHPLATPEQRAVLLAALRKTAADLSFDEQEFLRYYGWAQRFGVPTVAFGGEATVVPVTHDTLGPDGESPSA